MKLIQSRNKREGHYAGKGWLGEHYRRNFYVRTATKLKCGNIIIKHFV